MNAPTNATQAKERLYSQLSVSLTRMHGAIGRTADLCEQLQEDLNAMRTFAALDATKLMTVAANVTSEVEDEHNKR